MYNSDVQIKLVNQLISRSGKPFIHIYACFILVLFGWTVYNYLQFPFGLDYGEAPLMDQARRIEEHLALYKADLSEPPYIIANYPPIYPLAVAAVNTITHLPIFQSGRLISIFFSLISGLTIGHLAFQLTNRKLLALFSAATFLGNPYVLIWSSMARVDMMALAFSLLGLWALYQSRRSRYWLFAAGIFFIVSIYTRQSYLLAGPLAAIAWLWIINKRQTIFFGLAMIISTLIIFGTINALTHGGFYTNIIVANINAYLITRAVQMSGQLLTFWPVILIISGIIVAVLLKAAVQARTFFLDNHISSGFITYGLGAYTLGAVVSALTVGKVGSDVNYFLELIAICSLWCVLAIKYFLDQKLEQKEAIRSIFFGLLSLQVIWASLAGVVLSRSVIEPKRSLLTAYNTAFDQVKTAVQQGTVLSDDYLDMVVLSGQTIYYQPFEYGQLYHSGLWKPGQFITDINNGKFPLVLIGGDTLDKPCCWPAPVVSAVESKYSVTRSELGLVFTLK